jgi:hypothetical protein
LLLKLHYLPFVLWMLLSLPGFSQTAKEKLNLLDGKVELLVPSELTSMRNEMWRLKYHDMPRPILALTDDNGEINLIGDMTGQAATEEQLDAFKDFQIDHFKKSRPDIKMLDNGIRMINERKIGFFKFLSRAGGQKVFNYYFFTIVDGKVLLFTFNCIKELRSSWEKSADEMVTSLRVN